MRSVEARCGRCGRFRRGLELTSNIKQTQIIETKVVNAGMLRLPIPVPVLGSSVEGALGLYVRRQGWVGGPGDQGQGQRRGYAKRGKWEGRVWLGRVSIADVGKFASKRTHQGQV